MLEWIENPALGGASQPDSTRERRGTRWLAPSSSTGSARSATAPQLARWQTLDPAYFQHASPLGWENINLAGDYNWRINKRVAAGGLPAPSEALSRLLRP